LKRCSKKSTRKIEEEKKTVFLASYLIMFLANHTFPARQPQKMRTVKTQLRSGKVKGKETQRPDFTYAFALSLSVFSHVICSSCGGEDIRFFDPFMNFDEPHLCSEQNLFP
jgi:hypothetical protein